MSSVVQPATRHARVAFDRLAVDANEQQRFDKLRLLLRSNYFLRDLCGIELDVANIVEDYYEVRLSVRAMKTASIELWDKSPARRLAIIRRCS